MGIIYLVRHGAPQLPDGSRRCIGDRSDPPLSDQGIREARTLSDILKDVTHIYCSPMKRTMQTACLMAARVVPNSENGRGSQRITTLADLREMDVGAWEGKTFDEIRKTYPDTYEMRGHDWSVPPTDGESLAHAADRMLSVLTQVSEEEPDGSVLVCHDGMIRALLWKLQGLDPTKDPMPRVAYGSITIIEQAEGSWKVTAVGKLSSDTPTMEEINGLLDECQTPEVVRAHCKAVGNLCMEICSRLERAGVLLDRNQLLAAALLHDGCRVEGRTHPEHMARILRSAGYLRVAQMVAAHHSDEMAGCDEINEEHVLYLADKLVEGATRVTLEERFSKSESKCKDEEAKRYHSLRYRKAVTIRKALEQVIPLHESMVAECIRNDAEQRSGDGIER